MGVPLPIDNLTYARRLYHWAQFYKEHNCKWQHVKSSMEKEFLDITFKPDTYAAHYYRLEYRYGLKPGNKAFSYLKRRPLSELLGEEAAQAQEVKENDAEQHAEAKPISLALLPSSDAERIKPALRPIEEELALSVDRIQLQQTKREYTAALRERSRTEIICDAIKQGMIQLPPAAAPQAYAPIKPGAREYELILQMSDLQIGQYTRADETGGLVEYDISIFEERLANLERQIIRRVTEMRNAYVIKRLNIAGLGDFVENETIFRGQNSQIDTPVIEQFLQGSKAIADFICRLLCFFDEIMFVGVYGNHGRIGRKKEAVMYTNWDYLLYEFLKARLAEQPRLTFIIPKSWWYIMPVRNNKFLLTHGDNVQRWMSIPYYGIERADARQTLLLQSKGYSYDYWLVGHHHSATSIDRPLGERIINGAFPSGSVFSVHELTTASQPSQNLLFVGDHRVEIQEKLRIAEIE